jgi:hypothetical protein
MAEGVVSMMLGIGWTPPCLSLPAGMPASTDWNTAGWQGDGAEMDAPWSSRIPARPLPLADGEVAGCQEQGLRRSGRGRSTPCRPPP